MVEFDNNWIPDEEYGDDLLSILDFPVECLEGDGLLGHWDICISQCLGPITSDVLMAPARIPDQQIDTGSPHLFSGSVTPISGAPEQKQLSNYGGASSSLIRQQNKFANDHESGALETQSPVSVLDTRGSLEGKSLSNKSDKVIPVRSRSKRGRPSGANPWLMASLGFPLYQRTLNGSRSKESKKKLFQQHVDMGFVKDSPRNVEESFSISVVAHLQNASSHHPAAIKKCDHCEATKTPQWREGPLGPKTLCNACGVRHRTGGLFPEYRPAASPTFTPSQHSNSHKKVIEMRNNTKQAKIKYAPISSQPPAKTEEPLRPPSPQPEFVPMSSYLFDYIN